MPKQSGVFEIEGTLGNTTFYKNKDGFYVKRKSSISKERLDTDPGFARFRENRQEFTTSRHAEKVLLKPVRKAVHKTIDRKAHIRLGNLLLQILRTDVANPKGSRQVASGDLTMLRGFEFNGKQGLEKSLTADFTSTINRTTGELKVTLPAFVPGHDILAPGNTDYFRLVAIGIEADFLGNLALAVTARSAYLPYDDQATAPLTVTCAMPAASTLPLILVLAIEYWQEVNGVKYPVLDNSFNACAILAVDA